MKINKNKGIEKDEIDYIPIKEGENIPCVMCGSSGVLVWIKTNEVLCNHCVFNNEEARRKK